MNNPETEPITDVVFRTYRRGGDVIALFPYITADRQGGISCYQHIGQHGAADYAHVIATTRMATADEFAPLKRELEAKPYGYRLRVIRRRARR